MPIIEKNKIKKPLNCLNKNRKKYVKIEFIDFIYIHKILFIYFLCETSNITN